MSKTAVKITPLADRVLVAPSEDLTEKIGSLYVPDTAKERPQEGKVVAVGKGRALDEGGNAKPEVAVGDTVLYGKYSGSEVSVGGEDYLIMRESDILAVIK